MTSEKERDYAIGYGKPPLVIARIARWPESSQRVVKRPEVRVAPRPLSLQDLLLHHPRGGGNPAYLSHFAPSAVGMSETLRQAKRAVVEIRTASPY
jgi:hypothetical protein